MSVSLKLYSFAKDENSTAKPSGSAGTTYTGLLVEPCSVLNPTVKVSASVSAYSFNYAYISEFSRYYFITDCLTDNGFWYISMKVDPMASFKTVIGNSTQYVERCASAQDPYILDSFYPTTGELTKDVVEIQQGMQSYLEDGMFVLNITGSTQSTLGTYAMNWHSFEFLVNEMVLKYDDNSWWVNICQGVRNSVYEPFKHLGTVLWFPEDYIDTDGITATHTLQLGNVYIDGSAIHNNVHDMDIYYLDSPSVYTSTSVSLPKHPQASTYGKYMNLKPFTQYIYHDGVFGNIELDPLKLIDETTVSIGKITDPATGIQTLQLPDGQFRVGQVGVLVPMENNSLNIGGILTGAVSGIVGALSENAIGMTSGIASAVSSAFPVTNSVSQMGATVLTWQYTTIDCYFWKTAGHDDTHMGKPYCQTKKINTLSGYILCNKAHIDGTTMTATEQEMIVNIMNSGFYYA